MDMLAWLCADLFIIAAVVLYVCDLVLLLVPWDALDLFMTILNTMPQSWRCVGFWRVDGVVGVSLRSVFGPLLSFFPP